MKTSLLLFMGVFLFHLTAGLVVQTVLPKKFPRAHLGNGLWIGDAKNVHEDAVELADHGRREGWSWSYFMQRCHDGRRSIGTLFPWLTALVYRIFGVSPLVMLPFLAALISLAAVCFFQVLQRIGFSRAGSLWGGVWLACFPTTLEWTTQPLREGFFVAGHLVILRSLFGRAPLPSLLGVFGGSMLVFFARPSWSQLLVGQGICVLAILTLVRLRGKKTAEGFSGFQMGPVFALLGISLLGSFLLKEIPPSGGVFDGYQYRDGFSGFPPYRHGSLPGLSFLDPYGAKIYGARTTQIYAGGESLQDPDRWLGSLGEQVRYLPRAGLVALAAPFALPFREKKNPNLRVESWDPDSGRLRLRVGPRTANLTGYVLRFQAGPSLPLLQKDYVFKTHALWREMPAHTLIEISTLDQKQPLPASLDKEKPRVRLAQQDLFHASVETTLNRWEMVECLPHGGGSITGVVKSWLSLPMALSYLALGGLVAALGVRPVHPQIMVLVAYGLPILLFLALVCPTLGTLIRVRYAFWGCLTGVGVAWWTDFLIRRLQAWPSR